MWNGTAGPKGEIGEIAGIVNPVKREGRAATAGGGVKLNPDRIGVPGKARPMSARLGQDR